MLTRRCARAKQAPNMYHFFGGRARCIVSTWKFTWRSLSMEIYFILNSDIILGNFHLVSHVFLCFRLFFLTCNKCPGDSFFGCKNGTQGHLLKARSMRILANRFCFTFFNFLSGILFGIVFGSSEPQKWRARDKCSCPASTWWSGCQGRWKLEMTWWQRRKKHGEEEGQGKGGI